MSILAIGLLALPALFTATSASGLGPTTALVSVSASGVQANGDSDRPTLSADGRFVVFMSTASNLVSGPFASVWNVYRKNRLTGAVDLVNVPMDGQRSGTYSDSPVISATGRFVAFGSDAANLVPGDTNGAPDIFIRDVDAGTTTRASVNSTGAQADKGGGYFSSLSPDGRYVTFQSAATNLIPGTVPDITNIFLHDNTTGQTSLVSTGSGGPANGNSFTSSVSADGRRVVFDSSATNLAVLSGTGPSNVFLRDIATGSTSLLSQGKVADLTIEGGASGVISADGSTAAFTDTSLGALILSSVTTGGLEIGARDSAGRPVQTFEPKLSAEGRYVVFSSPVQLTSIPTAPTFQVYRSDRAVATTVLMSVSNDGISGDSPTGGYQGAFSVSADGQTVGFASEAHNLTSDDTRPGKDVFVRGEANTTSSTSSTTTVVPATTTTTTTAAPRECRQVVEDSGSPYLRLAETNLVGDIQRGWTLQLSVKSLRTEEWLSVGQRPLGPQSHAVPPSNGSVTQEIGALWGGVGILPPGQTARFAVRIDKPEGGTTVYGDPASWSAAGAYVVDGVFDKLFDAGLKNISAQRGSKLKTYARLIQVVMGSRDFLDVVTNLAAGRFVEAGQSVFKLFGALQDNIAALLVDLGLAGGLSFAKKLVGQVLNRAFLLGELVFKLALLARERLTVSAFPLITVSVHCSPKP